MCQILCRLGFSPIIVTLIESYFQDRITTYKWDSAQSRQYNFSLGTPQGDCLSPILSALYISVAIQRVFPETGTETYWDKKAGALTSDHTAKTNPVKYKYYI